MIYTKEVENMCPVAKGAYHGPAPIPQEGKWTQVKEVSDISGLTHGVGWCAPQQGACKLTLNIKEGIIEEALVETLGCSGMTHSAAMAGEILIGKTLLEALNTDLVCDAINTAMRELFLQIVYGRTQSAFSDGGLVIGAGLEDLGKGLRSMVGTMYATKAKSPFLFVLTRINVFRRAFELPVMTLRLLPRLIRRKPLLDEVRHLAERNEFVADNLHILVKSHTRNVTFSHFKISRTFFFSAVHSTDLRT